MAARRTGRRLVCAVALGAVLVGCGEGGDAGSSGDGVDHDRMYDVAGDPGATPDEVVAAGRAVEADRSGDGSLVVTYTVHNDDDEGLSQAAWRLYDADGEVVATGDGGNTEEGYARAGLIALEDGFVVVPENFPGHERLPPRLLAPDGSTTDVERPGRPLPAEPGDVFFSELPRRFLRPSTGAVFAPSPLPARDAQAWVLDAGGTQWYQGLGRAGDAATPFFRSRGDGWEQVAALTPPEGTYVASLALAVAGDWLAVPVLRPDDSQTHATLAAIAVRRVGAPTADPWRLVDASAVKGRNWYDVQVQALGDDALVVGGYGGSPYLLDLGSRRWLGRVGLPSAERDWLLDAGRDGLYAFGSSHADAWFSADRGETWERLPH